MKSKSFLIFSLLLILALLITGCQGDTPTPTEEPVPDDGGEDVVEPTDEPMPDEPETMRGSAGDLNIISAWGAKIANPYLTTLGSAAGFALEPLAYRDKEANLVPVLAAEIPTLENGGVAEDFMTVTWKLRDDVVWSDGTPFTADDVVFTFQYCANPETGCTRAQAFFPVAAMEALDDHTVLMTYKFPKAYTYDAFVEILVPVLQKAQFENCMGAAAMECGEENLAPVGTGPFVVDTFSADDVVVYVANENYRDPDKPYFASVTIKYGGDHVTAARSVTETGEFDIGMNTLLTRDLMEDILANATTGTLVTGGVTITEHYLLNMSNNRVEGDLKSEWAGGTNPHPFWTTPEIVQALSMAIDRQAYADRIHGIKGFPTCNFINRPPQYASSTFDGCEVQDVEGAMTLLDSVGAVDSNGDGVREFNGEEMSILLHGEGGPMTEGVLGLLKQWWEAIGLEVELKVTDPATYFSRDPVSPDTFWKFYADIQFSGIGAIGGPDPQLVLSFFTTRAMMGAENDWSGDNIPRYSSEEYDALFGELLGTPLGERRYEIVKQMNDLLVESGAAVALNGVGSVYAVANDIVGFEVNGWDAEIANIADWTRSE